MKEAVTGAHGARSVRHDLDQSWRSSATGRRCSQMYSAWSMKPGEDLSGEGFQTISIHRRTWWLRT